MQQIEEVLYMNFHPLKLYLGMLHFQMISVHYIHLDFLDSYWLMLTDTIIDWNSYLEQK